MIVQRGKQVAYHRLFCYCTLTRKLLSSHPFSAFSGSLLPYKNISAVLDYVLVDYGLCIVTGNISLQVYEFHGINMCIFLE